MKKGFVLIEVLIAICIFMIVITQVSSIFVHEYKNYISFCHIHKEIMSINDTLDFIESMVKYGQNYKVLDKSTIAIYENNYITKKIVLRNNKIQVLTMKNLSSSFTANTISQNNISSFQVENYGDYMMYVTIQSDKGEKYLRCI